MSYKLRADGVIHPQGFFVPEEPANRDWQEYQQWLTAGNTPDPADVPTPEQVAKALEMSEAHGIAKTWFSGQQAAIDFVRMTPAAQATAIDSMTLAQLRTVVKYVTIAVSMLIKRELL